MTVGEQPNRDALDLARRLADLERRVRGMERKSGLANSAISDGSLVATVNDVQTMKIGTQHDATNAASVLTGPTPPPPSAPTLDLSIPGGIIVRWDGTFESEAFTPMDFAMVTVHLVEDLIDFDPVGADLARGIIGSATGGSVFVASEGYVEVSVVLVTWSLAGKPSVPSVVSVGTAASAVATAASGTPRWVQGAGGNAAYLFGYTEDPLEHYPGQLSIGIDVGGSLTTLYSRLGSPVIVDVATPYEAFVFAGSTYDSGPDEFLSFVSLVADEVRVNGLLLGSLIDLGYDNVFTPTGLTSVHQGIHLSCYTVATSNVTLAGGAPNVVNGVTLFDNDPRQRVLVTGQTDPTENGPYVVATAGTGANGTWVRAEDGDDSADLYGAHVLVSAGTYGGSMWHARWGQGDVLDTDPMVWTTDWKSGWLTPTYSSGWGAAASGELLRYQREGDAVKVRGNFTKTGVGTTVTQLPTGYRPTATTTRPCVVAGVPGVAAISAAGDLTVVSAVLTSDVVSVEFQFDVDQP